MRIVYICGLGHSGSTILDMVLGAHSGMVGLGEVSRVLQAGTEEFKRREFTEILCSCGADMESCVFWSRVRENILQSGSESMSNRYHDLAATFSGIYGEDMILVDSSKIAAPYLLDLKKRHRLQVIFLARDFRSWSYSLSLKKKGSMAALPLRWLRKNRRVLEFLKKNDFDFFTLGYEEFAFYPDLIIPQICSRLGVEFQPGMLNPGLSSSHVIRGNTARGDPEKRQGIKYDARWMTSAGVSLLSALYFPLLAFNKKVVFSNILKKTGPGGSEEFMVFSASGKKSLIQEKWGNLEK